MVAKRTKRSFYTTWFDRWWTWEAIAACICCASTVALVIILKAYDGQPVPSFGTLFNSNLTLATTVSLLSTVTVSSALVTIQECLSQLKWHRFLASSRSLEEMETFDRASRGPFGSSILIWKLRCSPIASLGALLTITSLTIAPLTQQAATYALRQVADPFQTPTIAIANQVYEGSLQPQTFALAGSMSSAAKGAILTGLYSPANITLENVAPACASGNCTFAPYSSLAVCSSAKDVSSRLENVTSLLHEATEDSHAQYTTSFCIPGNHCLNVTKTGLCNVTSASGIRPTKDDYSPLLAFNSTAFRDHDRPLADVYIIYANISAHGPKGNNLLQALEFTLDWCVATFNTSVNSGVSVTSRIKHPIPYYTNNTALRGGVRHGAIDDLLMQVNETKEDQVVSTDYLIDGPTHAAMQGFFYSLFSGATLMGIGVGSGDSGPSIDPANDLALIMAQAVGWRPQPDLKNNPWTMAQSLDELNKILGNIATSMTNYHRSQGKLQANGTSFGVIPIVVVRWGYIAAPITFCVLNVVFFVTVAAGCHLWRKGLSLPVWKSSVVPLLRLMDPKLQEQLGSLLEGDKISSGHGLKLRLVVDGKGWQLRAVQDDLKAQDEYPLTQFQRAEDENGT